MEQKDEKETERKHMKIIKNPNRDLNVIFWDFDGVLMNSNAIRDSGFAEVLKDFPDNQVEQLLEFHKRNGGLSRYVKFRYFFEQIRGESISEDEVLLWAQKFSLIMREMLTDEDLLIEETLKFIKRWHNEVPMHIVSGSDQEELRYLCKKLEIDILFKSIHGSPKPKTQWVGEILEWHGYNLSASVLIGDSKNDYDAAIDNDMAFMGYNNPEVEILSSAHIEL